eukprot:m.88420 g.88420  ORF g.88420 m.88420 type:complete len:58 (-) comp26195_c2_seq1:165-338(-)
MWKSVSDKVSASPERSPKSLPKITADFGGQTISTIGLEVECLSSMSVLATPFVRESI